MFEWCVTVNVGGGPGNTTRRTQGMTAWARGALAESPAVVFAQEVPNDGWIHVWTTAGYTVTLGCDRGWKIRSALLTRPDLKIQPMGTDDCPSLWYHGSYVACARWLNAHRDPITLVSLHATPNQADLLTYGWPSDLISPPTPRSGGADTRWTPNRLWDSDTVLATLLHLQRSGPVIAAGDFNESRLDDVDLHGSPIVGWGSQYFQFAHDAGLVEFSLDPQHREIPTRGGLQLDHLLASQTLLDDAGWHPGAYVDTAWSEADPADLSDHAALWVPLPVPYH